VLQDEKQRLFNHVLTKGNYVSGGLANNGWWYLNGMQNNLPATTMQFGKTKCEVV
jgi:hypothetical protein